MPGNCLMELLVLLQRTPELLIQSSTYLMRSYHVLVRTRRTSSSWHVMLLAFSHPSASSLCLRPCTISSVATLLWCVLSELLLESCLVLVMVSMAVAMGTKQVAGTEEGIKEPQATFSACFGAAFIMLHPTRYAAMLVEKMQKYGATAWLVNTGWSGGR